MSAGRLVPLLLGAAVAGANGVMFQTALAGPLLTWVIAGPMVIAIVASLMSPRTEVTRVVSVPAPPPPPGPPPETAALHLLGALQEEGRLIDFLLEEIAPYSDEQIGAAVRGIHDPCRKALRGCLTIETVMPGAEGDAVTVAEGFDPSAVRLVGNVTGQAPFSGALRHAGWRVTAVNIPEPKGRDPRVLAPAEVELP